MIEWNKYIKWGKFISTSGIELDYKWEFDGLNDNIHDNNLILTSILSLSYPFDIVAIHTINPASLEHYCTAKYYPNTNVSDGSILNDYVLFDDVVTTGKSMLKAIDKYKKPPKRCICIVDRRKEILDVDFNNLDIISIERDILKKK